MQYRENPIDIPAFERKISECFEGGQVLQRELRLTGPEASYMAQNYPAILRPMGGGWYEITFQGALQYGN